MEVHHHSHNPPDKNRIKKRWSHYFWEFLMLFLAVLCGFLAENFREHYVEDQRAIKNANNLYKELYNDSISLQQCLVNRARKESECRYFIAYVRDSSLTNLSSRFFPSFAAAIIQNQYIIFEPNEGLLNQLRNSGELRYFKDKNLQAELGNLSGKISYVNTRNDKEYSYVEFYTRPLALKYFDFEWYEKLTRQGALTLVKALEDYNAMEGIGKLVAPNKFDRRDAESVASYYLLMMRATRLIAYKEYAEANHRVMSLLRNQYKIK